MLHFLPALLLPTTLAFLTENWACPSQQIGGEWTQTFRAHGAAAEDLLECVAGIGDLDGDGRGDVILGARGHLDDQASAHLLWSVRPGVLSAYDRLWFAAVTHSDGSVHCTSAAVALRL